MVVILWLRDVCFSLLYYNTCMCIIVAMSITLVVNEILEWWFPWNHVINVWSLWCTCDCDCGVYLGIGFPCSNKLIWFTFPCSKTTIGSGYHVPTQLWDWIATFRQVNYLGLGSLRGPMMCDNCMLIIMLIIL